MYNSTFALDNGNSLILLPITSRDIPKKNIPFGLTLRSDGFRRRPNNPNMAVTILTRALLGLWIFHRLLGGG